MVTFSVQEGQLLGGISSAQVTAPSLLTNIHYHLIDTIHNFNLNCTCMVLWVLSSYGDVVMYSWLLMNKDDHHTV